MGSVGVRWSARNLFGVWSEHFHQGVFVSLISISVRLEASSLRCQLASRSITKIPTRNVEFWRTRRDVGEGSGKWMPNTFTWQWRRAPRIGSGNEVWALERCREETVVCCHATRLCDKSLINSTPAIQPNNGNNNLTFEWLKDAHAARTTAGRVLRAEAHHHHV